MAQDIDYRKVNQAIRKWGNKTHKQLLREIIRLNIKNRKNSRSPKSAINSISLRFRTRGGVINRIGWVMPRHMIYVHKGVGKDTPIEKAGTTNRKAKEWYNPVVDQNMEELADVVAAELGQAIINKLAIN